MSELGLLALVCLGAVVVHEGAHVWAARACGWTFTGVHLRWWGIAIGTKTSDLRDLWKVALAGPLASLLFALLCLPFLSLHPIFWIGFWINLIAFAVNLLPLPVSDGGHLWRAMSTNLNVKRMLKIIRDYYTLRA